MVLVSVVLPLYNCQDFVEEAIDSIIQQSYKNWELIIVNDGSTDNSKKIINRYAQRHRKIKIINHLKNKGISATRNTGVKHSKGEFISFLSSDDKWKPSFLKDMLEHKKEKGIIFCNYDMIGKKGGHIRTQDFRTLLEVPNLETAHSFDKLWFKNKVYAFARKRDMFVNYSAILGNKEYFEGINNFCNEFRYGEDLYHILKVSSRVKFTYFPKSLVEYRQHPANTTNKFLGEIKDNNEKIFKKVEEERKKGAKNILNIGRNYTQSMKDWKKHFDKYKHLYPYDYKMRNLAFIGSKDLSLGSPKINEVIEKTDIFIFHIQKNGNFSCKFDWNKLTKNKDVYTFVDNMDVEINKDSLKKSKNVFCNDLKVANKFKIRFVPFMDIKDFTKLLFQKKKKQVTKIVTNSKKINILNISFSDPAGIMAKWKNLFDKYSEKYTLRNLVNVTHAFDYKIDLLPNSPELKSVIENTDIFIFHICVVFGESINGGLIEDGVNSQICDVDWYKVTRGKKVYAFLDGSTNLRHFAGEYNRFIPKNYEKTFCSTPDLALLFKFAKYIPVPLEIDAKFPIRAENKLTICHLPTDPNIKNTKEFEIVCNELKKEFPMFFDYEVATLVSNEESINIKKRCHLCFDHMQGYYGVNSLEASIVGCIPLVGINHKNIEMFRKYVKSDNTPFEIVRNKEELKNCIRYYIIHPKEVKKDGKKCYNWMKRYWNPKKHLKKIEGYL